MQVDPLDKVQSINGSPDLDRVSEREREREKESYSESDASVASYIDAFSGTFDELSGRITIDNVRSYCFFKNILYPRQHLNLEISLQCINNNIYSFEFVEKDFFLSVQHSWKTLPCPNQPTRQQTEK